MKIDIIQNCPEPQFSSDKVLICTSHIRTVDTLTNFPSEIDSFLKISKTPYLAALWDQLQHINVAIQKKLQTRLLFHISMWKKYRISDQHLKCCFFNIINVHVSSCYKENALYGLFFIFKEETIFLFIFRIWPSLAGQHFFWLLQTTLERTMVGHFLK